MTHYNRSNPFLYILDRSNDTLIADSKDTIKHIIILVCLSICWTVSVIISSVICKQLWYPDLLEFLIVLIANGYSILNVRLAIRQNKTLLIDEKKYPESEFTYTYFNNEILFQDTINISHHIGRLSMLRNQISLFWGLILLGIVVRIIGIINNFL